MPSGKRIRRARHRQMGRLIRRRKLFGSWISEQFCRDLAAAFAEALALVRVVQPAHVFKPGEFATRDGSDVQRVLDVSGNCADFECVKAPASGWCEVGEVEYNLMCRYRLLPQDDLRGVL